MPTAVRHKAKKAVKYTDFVQIFSIAMRLRRHWPRRCVKPASGQQASTGLRALAATFQLRRHGQMGTTA